MSLSTKIHWVYFFLLVAFTCNVVDGKKIQNRNKYTEEKSEMLSSAEYIFSLSKPLTDIELRSVFAGYEILLLTEVNKTNLSYKIKFVKDPGLEALKERVDSNPNFRYIEKNSYYNKNK